MPTTPEPGAPVSIGIILLHDSQGIIDAIENNRTIIIENSNPAIKSFPVAFTKDPDYAISTFDFDFIYNDSLCNYFYIPET